MSTSPVVVTCFSHVGLTVSDLAASTDFYGRVLGFRTLYRDEQADWTRVGMTGGDVVVELFGPRADFPGPTVDPMYPREFGLPKLALTIESAEETYARLVGVGITPLCPIATTSATRFFFLADPDGTPIQLQEFLGGRRRLAELFPPPA